jgi:hypothetical protein
VADGGLHASVGAFLANVAEELSGPVRMAEKARVLPMGVASWESPELRASFPATLRHAPSRVERRRGYLGLTTPQPPRWAKANIRGTQCSRRALSSAAAIGDTESMQIKAQFCRGDEALSRHGRSAEALAARRKNLGLIRHQHQADHRLILFGFEFPK